MAAPAMDDLADRFADRGVTSVFVYTREAHPGEHYRQHTSQEVKRAHARAFVKHSSVRRRILLDDLEGSAHRGYGILPNMTWIVARGLVLYKAAWTDVADVEDALVEALRALPLRREQGLRPVYSERLVWRGTDPEAFRDGLARGGPQALSDFFGTKAEPSSG